jgi:hypothetical protein
MQRLLKDDEKHRNKLSRVIKKNIILLIWHKNIYESRHVKGGHPEYKITTCKSSHALFSLRIDIQICLWVLIKSLIVR